MDHFVVEVLRPKGYLRYVDDFALFDDDARRLAEMRQRLAGFLGTRRLSLHPRKTEVVSTRKPAQFLGYELWPHGIRRLPADNVRRFGNRLRSLRDRWRAGTVTEEEVRQRIQAWIAHAEQAHTLGQAEGAQRPKGA